MLFIYLIFVFLNSRYVCSDAQNIRARLETCSCFPNFQLRVLEPTGFNHVAFHLFWCRTIRHPKCAVIFLIQSILYKLKQTENFHNHQSSYGSWRCWAHLAPSHHAWLTYVASVSILQMSSSNWTPNDMNWSNSILERTLWLWPKRQNGSGHY